MFDLIPTMTADIVVALISLTTLEIVLGIDNLIFMAVLVQKLPADRQGAARMLGLGMALVMRLALLLGIVWIIQLTEPLFVAFGHPMSVRDLVLIGGGLFLLYKAADEMHERLEVDAEDKPLTLRHSFTSVVLQIAVVNLVFSLDSIVTAIGMTDSLFVMAFAIVVSTAVMIGLARPLGDFMHAHPSLVMLSFGFLMMIGLTLIVEAFGVHIPKAYLYSAMAFSVVMEFINIWARKAAKQKVELKSRLAAAEKP